MIKVGILTLSDKGSRGEREDKSGQILSEMVREIGGEVLSHQVLPDEKDVIVEWLVRMVDHQGLDLVLTTGGTGIAARDVTPEATREVIERPTPGLDEAMRSASMAKTAHAMLSRGVSGICKAVYSGIREQKF